MEFNVDIGLVGGGLDHRMMSRRGIAAAHRALRGQMGQIAEEKISHPSGRDSQLDFNLWPLALTEKKQQQVGHKRLAK